MYRIYVTDTLKYISENTAAVSAQNGVNGKYMTKRFYELLNPVAEDTRSAEDVISGIKNKLQRLI